MMMHFQIKKDEAEDFVFSFERVWKGSINSPGGWIFNGRVAKEKPFQAIDNQTFVVKLAKPFRPMLGILTMQYCSVVPMEAVEKYGADFRIKITSKKKMVKRCHIWMVYEFHLSEIGRRLT